MKVRTWVIVVAFIGVPAAIGAFLYLLELWNAKTQIDAWSQTKYQSRTPVPDLPIEVVGQQSEWHIRCPSSRRIQGDLQLVEHFAGETSADREQADDLHFVNELHLWKECTVQIHLKSRDVLHNFFVPSVRLKEDAVPGKVKVCWFVVSQSNVTWNPKAGDWEHGDLLEFVCAEFGQGHRKMKGQLFVYETKDDFLRWLTRAEELRPQRPSERE